MAQLPGPFGFLRPLGVAGGMAIGVAVGQGVSPTIRPVVQDIANRAWELHQVRPLEPSIAAQLVAEGFWQLDQGQAEAARTGISAERFGALVQEARRGPTIEQAFEGVRRGLLDDGDLIRAMRQAGVRPEWDELMRALVEYVPSPSDMVRFAVREAYTPDIAQRFGQYEDFPEEFATDAENVGITRERALQYWAAHWDLPSPEQGFAMFHRGIIDQSDLERLLRALDVMPFWRERLIQLQERLAPLQDLIRFAVREVYTPDVRQEFGLDEEFPQVFADEAARHGLPEETARAYWAAHWQLPSPEQGFAMFHRKLITREQLELLLRTRDVMPYWRDRLIGLAYRLPTRVDLRRMFRRDVLTEQQVLEGYEAIGYSPEAARALTDFAVAEKQDAATGGPIVPRYRRAVIARAHREFLDQSIDAARARQVLERVGVPADSVSEVLALWALELELYRRELTPAQVRAAFRKDEYTRDQALAELEERGMSAEDAAVFLDS